MRSLTSEASGVAWVRGGVVRRVIRRLRVRMRRRRLDAMLADGRDPWSSPSCRSCRTARFGRAEAELAAALESLLILAELRRSASPYAPLRYDVVLDERDGIVEIAARLREPAPVRVAIVAGLAVLAWDRSSPVFASGRPAAGVGGTVRSCADALRAVH